jgi:hypothetical protein
MLSLSVPASRIPGRSCSARSCQVECAWVPAHATPERIQGKAKPDSIAGRISRSGKMAVQEIMKSSRIVTAEMLWVLRSSRERAGWRRRSGRVGDGSMKPGDGGTEWREQNDPVKKLATLSERRGPGPVSSFVFCSLLFSSLLSISISISI